MSYFKGKKKNKQQPAIQRRIIAMINYENIHEICLLNKNITLSESQQQMHLRYNDTTVINVIRQ